MITEPCEHCGGAILIESDVFGHTYAACQKCHVRSYIAIINWHEATVPASKTLLKMHGRMMKEVNHQQQANRRKNKIIRNLQKRPRWIPATKHLPKYGGWIFVKLDGRIHGAANSGRIFMALYGPSFGFISPGTEPLSVTHWLFIPEARKQRDKQNKGLL